MPSSGVFVLPIVTKPGVAEALRRGGVDRRSEAGVLERLHAQVQRLAGERRAEVLEQERDAAEGPVGQLASGRLARLLEELVDDRVELGLSASTRAIAASTSSAGATSPVRTSSACAVASISADAVLGSEQRLEPDRERLARARRPGARRAGPRA